MFDIDNLLNNIEVETDCKLDKQDYEYFDGLIKTLSVTQYHISYYGIEKKLYLKNPYTTIRTDITWEIKRKRKFEKYINEKFVEYDNPSDAFNKWCMAFRLSYIRTEDRLPSLYSNIKVNLVFFRNNKKLHCYALKNRDNREVEYITCTDNKVKFEQAVIQYLRYYLHLPELVKLSDASILKIIRRELTEGRMIDDSIQANEILKVSNDKYKYCLSYIELPDGYKGEGHHPSWDLFTDQFGNDKDRSLFRAWVYGVFVEQDMGRQTLWIQGEGYTGKSTIASVIGEILSEHEPNLFNSITVNKFNRIDMTNFENARFVVFSNATDQYFLSRDEVMVLTGNDYVRLRKLYHDPENKKLFVKIMINSNTYPKYNAKVMHEDTRIIHLKMDSKHVKETRKRWETFKTPFAVRLKQEFNEFLLTAHIDYHNYMGKDGLINKYKI